MTHGDHPAHHRGRRPRWPWAALLVVLALLQTAGASSQTNPDVTQVVSSAIELVGQTPTVASGGTFQMVVRLTGIPEAGSLELAVYGRVRSRSELAASMEGEQLRGQVYRVSLPVASLPPATDGTRQISLSLDQTMAGGLNLPAAGVYPVEIQALDAAGASLASLVTHLILRPDPTDASPPLAVALVARLDSPPSLQPDGTVDLPSEVVSETTDLAAALASVPDVPATLAVRPELLDAIGAAADPSTSALLDQLKVAATGRPVMALPYVDVSPDALAEAGLTDELAHQLEQGRLILADALGRTPSLATWMAGPDLDLPGLRLLQRAGVRHVVVSSTQVQPLRSGLLSLSLAQPFVIRSTDKPVIDAMALDPKVTARLGTKSSPGLEVSRVLAEIALLWFEQPAVARGVVLPVDLTTRGDVVRGLLEGLANGGMFKGVALDDVFTATRPLRQPGGARVDRALRPGDPRPISGALGSDLLAARAALASFTGLVGPDSPRAGTVASQLLLTTAAELSRTERQAHLQAASASMAAVSDAIGAPARETITLTARDGNVPLTLRNDSGLPVNVVVHLRSPKLEFPNGTVIPVTLTNPTTRLNISVRTRASGRFPLDVTVTTPDGALALARVDYQVQSTAVSGVGLVLSIGAACFLLVWWARHWRRTRRSAKLVAMRHPSNATGAHTTTPSDAGEEPADGTTTTDPASR